MEHDFDFRDLFVLDLANNHQGDIDHGLRIIDGCAAVANKHDVRAAIKFQFRQLDTFIHPAHQQQSDNKHIPRFSSTRLSRDDYATLLTRIRHHGLYAMCTPFDEESVDVIVEMGFDILKVASCSARDWPLLDAIAEAGKPVIFSTGGLRQEYLDDVVSFFEHRAVDFAVMHCVSIYPTPDEECNLANISTFCARYPGRIIGWSTHEDPNDTMPIAVAAAQGARMFERHVGQNTDDYKLNAYSSTPEQLDAWMAAWKKARVLCGDSRRRPATDTEQQAIDSLRRGVFARRPIEANQMIERADIYFAMPYQEGQLASGEWRQGIVSTTAVAVDAPVELAEISVPSDPRTAILKSAVHDVKAMLNEARIALSAEFKVEYSHHVGIERFREIGAVLITCIDRAYCKKLIVQLPGQQHPAHFHKRKEETFQILSGELHSEVEGRHRILHPGDTQVVLPGVWHRFWTDTGVVFEEVSTTQFSNDSVYKDPAIRALSTEQRKTVVDHWGRFQLGDPVDAPNLEATEASDQQDIAVA